MKHQFKKTNIKNLVVLCLLATFAAQAQNVRPPIPKDVQKNILPIQKILAEARALENSNPDEIMVGEKKASQQAQVERAFAPPVKRTSRTYIMTPQGLVIYSGNKAHPRAAPVAAEGGDPQGDADANDGADQTAFEEAGSPLDPAHLATFRLCKGSRTEQGINTLNTYWMAALSSIAYLKYPLAFDRLKQMGFDDVYFVESASDVEVLVAKKHIQKDAQGKDIPDSGLNVVAFRGTDKPEDWLTNLNATTQDISGHENEAWVHAGFALALDEVYAKILEVLDLKNDPSPLFITGHSLGGALGMQMAIRLVSKDSAASEPLIGPKDNRLRGVYVFAAPREGNVWARVILDQYMNRTRNVSVHLHADDDPVPKVPFDWMGYSRMGVQAVLPYDEKEDVDFGNRNLWVCHDDVDYKGPSAFSWDLMHSSIDAHYMKSYVRHFIPWRSKLDQISCSDATAVWGPRFPEQDPTNYRPLRTADQERKNPCDHTTFSWGGNPIQ